MKTPLEDKAMAHFGRTLIGSVRDHQVENWTLHIVKEINSGNPDYVDLGTEALGRFIWLLPQIIDSTLRQVLAMIEDGETSGIALSVTAEGETYSNMNTASASLTEALSWWILAFSKQRYTLDPSEPRLKAAVLNFAKPQGQVESAEGQMLSISMRYMQERCFSHQDIVAKQRACFDEMRDGKREHTMDGHSAIARESLIAGNVPEDEAAELTSESRRVLEGLGLTEPEKIPWASQKHMHHPALVYFGKSLVEEVRDFTIHDWDKILNGTMRSILAGDAQSRFQSLSPQARAFVHDLTPKIVDKTLHYMMMLLQQGDVNGIRVMIALEDGSTFPSLDAISDGLAGDLVDWIPAFTMQRTSPWPYQRYEPEREPPPATS